VNAVSTTCGKTAKRGGCLQNRQKGWGCLQSKQKDHV